jgi:hypothetical protein
MNGTRFALMQAGSERRNILNVSPISTVLPLHPPKTRGIEDALSDKPAAVGQPAPQGPRISSVISPALLSAETKKHLTFAVQDIASESEHAHKTPPAQEARAALAANPELGDLPFGALVSAIARGEPLPGPASSSNPEEDTTAPPVVDELATQSPDPNLVPDETATAMDLIGDELANPSTIGLTIEEILNLPDVL